MTTLTMTASNDTTTFACKRCHQRHPREQMVRSAKSPSGVGSYCLGCMKAYNAARRGKPAESVMEPGDAAVADYFAAVGECLRLEWGLPFIRVVDVAWERYREGGIAPADAVRMVMAQAGATAL